MAQWLLSLLYSKNFRQFASYRPSTLSDVAWGRMLSAIPLPPSDFGTMMTLASMRGMVYREFMAPAVRLLATDIVRGAGGKDGVEQAYMIRDFLMQHTEFLRDPDGVEMLHGPVWQVQQILSRGVVQVDCDDVAMLGAALAKSIGLRARFVAVAFLNNNAPYRHVWAEIGPSTAPPKWIDLDVTRPAQGLPFGYVSRTLVKEV